MKLVPSQELGLSNEEHFYAVLRDKLIAKVCFFNLLDEIGLRNVKFLSDLSIEEKNELGFLILQKVNKPLLSAFVTWLNLEEVTSIVPVVNAHFNCTLTTVNDRVYLSLTKPLVLKKEILFANAELLNAVCAHTSDNLEVIDRIITLQGSLVHFPDVLRKIILSNNYKKLAYVIEKYAGTSHNLDISIKWALITRNNKMFNFLLLKYPITEEAIDLLKAEMRGRIQYPEAQAVLRLKLAYSGLKY